jgi:hypothetical protein
VVPLVSSKSLQKGKKLRASGLDSAARASASLQANPSYQDRPKNYELALPINYAGLAILFNILGLAALYTNANPQSALLHVLALFLGNFLMFIGYLYILKRVRQWGAG